MSPSADTAAHLLALERAAMDRWAQGDTGGFLELSAEDITYFDPFTAQRIDGLDALRAWYAPFHGKFHIDRYEFIDPVVQLAGDAAVLTYRFDSQGSEGAMRWNTTEVYKKSPAGWKLIHTHWAYYQPKLATK